jgi:predicted amidohydrolase
MKIALIQTNPQTDIEKNIEQIYLLAQKAMQLKADVLVLPEMFSYMGNELARYEHADTLNPISGVFLKIQQLAQQAKCFVVGGSHSEKCANTKKVYNTGCVFNSTGELISVYRKNYLFNLKDIHGNKLYCESDSFLEGSEKNYFDINGFNCQYAICYDLRFPEFFRTSGKHETPADIIFLPAAFTHQTGQAHWETLVKARAIENQCYVVACNQTGFHTNGTKQNWGHSMVVCPWGNVVAALSEEEGILYADIFMDNIKEARLKLPALQDRKFINYTEDRLSSKPC